MHLSITGQYLARYQRIAAGDGESDLLPVTGAQRRFALVRSLDPAGRPDIVPMFFAFPRGTVDPVRLRAAANHLAARHPVLRARPEVLRGTPALRLAEPDVPVERRVRAPGEDAADALRRALSAWTAQGSPLRLFLCRGRTGCRGRGARRRTGPRRLRRPVAGTHRRGARAAAYATGSAPETSRPPTRPPNWPPTGKRSCCSSTPSSARGRPPRWSTGADGCARCANALRCPVPQALAPGTLPTGAAELRLPAPASGVPFPALLDACRAAARVLYGAGHVSPIGYPWGGRPAAAAPVVGCFLNTVVFPAGTDDAPGGPSGDDPFGAEATAAAWWDDLDRADTPFDEVVHAARSAGSLWSGRLDGLLTVDDARRRPPLSLGGVAGREIHIDGRPSAPRSPCPSPTGRNSTSAWCGTATVLDDRTAEDGFGAFCAALPAPERADSPSAERRGRPRNGTPPSRTRPAHRTPPRTPPIEPHSHPEATEHSTAGPRDPRTRLRTPGGEHNRAPTRIRRTRPDNLRDRPCFPSPRRRRSSGCTNKCSPAAAPTTSPPHSTCGGRWTPRPCAADSPPPSTVTPDSAWNSWPSPARCPPSGPLTPVRPACAAWI